MLIHPFAALVYVFYHKLHNCSFWISVRSYSIFVYPIYAPFEVLVYGIAFDKIIFQYTICPLTKFPPRFEFMR